MNELSSINYGSYAVQSFEFVDWNVLLKLKKISSSKEDSPFTGISSYFGKLNVFNLTRQNFLAYLNFYSSISPEYSYMYEEYKKICYLINSMLIAEVRDNKEIEKKYEQIIKRHFDEVTKLPIKELKSIYLTFFKNYIYFKDFSIGYSFYFQKVGETTKYYANIVGANYSIKPETPSMNCVEFDTSEDLKSNFRLFPFIPLNVDYKNPKLNLAIFGNNKWVVPVKFAFPYKNEKKPNYYYSVNSFNIVKSIEDLNKGIFSIEVDVSVDSYYFNGKLYPASDNEMKGKLSLFQRKSTKEVMVGVPLFNSGMEWIEKPL